jgi:hypothetical protein
MRADEIVTIHGKDLIGREIITMAIGSYPGGVAKVTDIHPDPAAPEIPIQVIHRDAGTMGIFEWEDVTLIGPAVKPVGHNRHGYGSSPFEWL